MPLFDVPGIRFVTLQKPVPARDLALAETIDSLWICSDDLTDYGETAALIANLDLVITIDSSVAHLAGAMGKPVWILLPALADWRWLKDTDTSPWYPSARLFRQPTAGDWASPIARVATELRQLTSQSRQNPAPRQIIAMATANRHQGQFAAAVIMPTILRPAMIQAAASVFQQNIGEPCQLLIGIDANAGDPGLLNAITRICPPHWSVMVFDPGYSTSLRHGGLHPARDGGALRTILSYTANSRYLAYLDDDNWWAPNHLPSLLKAIAGVDYAFSYRLFVDADTGRPAGIDSWESVGPEKGAFTKRFGGFIDPNTLMVDKTRCEPVLRLWSTPLEGDPKGMSADRNVFHRLSTRHTGKCTGAATCFYRMDPRDPLHAERMDRLTKPTRPRKSGDV